MATITNLNAHALMNSAKGYIKALQETKTTMVKVVTDWNICVAQSNMITYNFPVGEYKRKAHLIADFERVIEQLNEMAFAPVEERVEVMVQDIKAGDNVVCPTDVSDVQTVVKVDDFSCYFKITFNGSMGTQTFDRGETLIVCDSNDTQINNVSTSEDLQMTNIITASNCTFSEVPANGVFSQAGTSPLSLYSYFWKTSEGEAANVEEANAITMNLLPVQFDPNDRVQVWGVENTWQAVNDLITAHISNSRRFYIQNETDAQRLAAFALTLPESELASFLSMIQTHCTEEFTSEVLTAFHTSVEPEIQERLNSLLHTAQA